MATYTEDTGFNKGVAAIPNKGLTKISMIEVTLNWGTIAADRLAKGQTAIGAGDVLEVMQIPAKTYVICAGLDVTTAEGATCTVDMGDGTDPDGFLDGVNANTAASYATALVLAEAAPNTVVGYSNGKYYAAADTIDIKTVNAADAAVMRMWALVSDCS